VLFYNLLLLFLNYCIIAQLRALCLSFSTAYFYDLMTVVKKPRATHRVF